MVVRAVLLGSVTQLRALNPLSHTDDNRINQLVIITLSMYAPMDTNSTIGVEEDQMDCTQVDQTQPQLYAISEITYPCKSSGNDEGWGSDAFKMW